MSTKKISLILTLALLAALNPFPGAAVENNELASSVLEPSKYVKGDKTAIENLITSQLSNRLFSTGYGISIRDNTDGTILFESNAQNSMLPASLTKLYTAASTAITLDPDARFVTKVKYLNNNVYLVGGADPQLGTESNPTQADLADLAKETAQKLKEFNVFEVNVFIDDAILGPLQRPADWEDTYFQSSEIHLISALNIDDPSAPAKAPVDPSITTGQKFAFYLIKNNIKVNGFVNRKNAPKDAFELSTQYSKSVSQLIEDTLMISNNQDAEILARVTSLVSENDPSTKAATELVLKDVELLGISSVDNAITDASGLSRSNKISPSDLSEIIYKSIKNPVITKVNKGETSKFMITPILPITPDPWSVFTGLPTGHGLGTMKKRFDENNSAGRGVVRAKTGSLNRVITLAGTITTKDNVFLSFAILVNRVEEPENVREAIDNLLNELAECNCAPTK
ncbi:MAG: D-alanyl-D-alanine carboxypeptidase/D-alanyl-D-alanine-endopeptidase [Planctomycetota bacterium]|jgi:D-alanyl-D-alanine carboxypeptidase/D-alanyl-D-alanine-endopeptidase (penicillin-binding protein 4)|nr:D-alanyl-D-alanine carboxypeptidase [Candidatus Nanopelagicales bacterium]